MMSFRHTGVWAHSPAGGTTMSFVIEFVKQALSASMEDPVERRAAQQKHITEVKAKCDSLWVPGPHPGVKDRSNGLNRGGISPSDHPARMHTSFAN
jgi:hypothetical protein